MTAKRRGAKNSGSVYYDANARRWCASVTITGPDGRRARRKMTAPDEATAKRHLKAMLAERDETGTVAPKDITVSQVLDGLLAHPPATWKSATTVRVNTQLAARLRDGLGTVLLSRLTAGQVEEHLRREVVAGMSRRTVRDQKALLIRAVERAEKHDLVGRNVAKLADMPEGALTRESGAMTVEQAERLLASDLTPFWRAWLTVALLLGLRPGETGALAWDDIGGGVLRVRHSLHETPGGGLEPGPLKTEQSRRTLALPQKVTDALLAWRAEQITWQLACPAWQDTGLVFTDGQGLALNRQRVNRGFRAACKAAGIARPDGRPFQVREMRHTCVSVLSAHGVPIEQIADVVGHVNSSVTREVYRKQIADKIQVTATVMDEIFEPGSAE